MEEWQHIIKQEENNELFQIFEETNRNLRQVRSNNINNGGHCKNCQQKCKGTQRNLADIGESA
mgnify:CR=1 FL=1